MTRKTNKPKTQPSITPTGTGEATISVSDYTMSEIELFTAQLCAGSLRRTTNTEHGALLTIACATLPIKNFAKPV